MRTRARSGSVVATGVVIGVGLLVGRPAAAQAPAGAPPTELRREQLGSYGAADAARARARRGDCEGALTLFDQALSTIDDPTLHRDRGLCHDRLGHPWPAIDDYRAYLFRAPDAPDADDIRVRLERLEAQEGVGGPSPYKTENERGGASATLTVQGKSERYDSVKDEEADTSGPLRRGTGWVLAPVAGIRKWFNSDLSSSTWAENVGLRLAWVWSNASSFLLEAGYERFNTGDAGDVTLGGLTSQLGYEARLPFDVDTNLDNLWILGIGLSYEHLVYNFGPTSGLTAPSLGGIGGRARAGYRHNFGARAALEASLDGGVAKFFTYGSGSTSATTATPWVGLNVALLFGM